MLVRAVSELCLPLDAALLLGALGLLLGLRGRRRPAAAAGTLGLVVLLLASLRPAADALAGSLESLHPAVRAAEAPAAGAIVVLGGCVGHGVPPRNGPELVEASDRVLHAARLYRAGKAPLVVASGGRLPWRRDPRSEAEEIAELLVEWGVPRAAIALETRSTTTAENARETARLLAERKVRDVLLVTSALHMERSLASFRRAGVRAVPASCDVRVVRYSLTPLDWIPSPEALTLTHAALWERLGLVWYRLRGVAG